MRPAEGTVSVLEDRHRPEDDVAAGVAPTHEPLPIDPSVASPVADPARCLLVLVAVELVKGIRSYDPQVCLCRDDSVGVDERPLRLHLDVAHNVQESEQGLPQGLGTSVHQ